MNRGFLQSRVARFADTEFSVAGPAAQEPTIPGMCLS